MADSPPIYDPNSWGRHEAQVDWERIHMEVS